jgi:hypothetical protein
VSHARAGVKRTCAAPPATYSYGMDGPDPHQQHPDDPRVRAARQWSEWQHWYAWQQWYAWQDWYARQQGATQWWRAPGDVLQPQPAGVPTHRRSSRRYLVGSVVAIAVIVLLAAAFAAAVFNSSVSQSDGDRGALAEAADGVAVSSPVASTTGGGEAKARPYTPSEYERTYFMRVGFGSDGGKRLKRWEKPIVRVVLKGDVTSSDRAIVNRMVATVNATVHYPTFVVRTSDADISIRIVDHAEFERHNDLGSDVIGICGGSTWRVTHTLAYSQIYIDDSSEYRSDRAGVICHEFGHAVGLDDTRDPVFDDTIMYYRANSAQSFTSSDIAALRILYDPRMDSGDSRAEVRRIWETK